MRRYAWAMLALFCAVAFVLVATESGCSHNERPACSAQTLAELEALYLAEVLAACQGTTLEQCPEAARIEAAHQQRLEEWARCQ